MSGLDDSLHSSVRRRRRMAMNGESKLWVKFQLKTLLLFKAHVRYFVMWTGQFEIISTMTNIVSGEIISAFKSVLTVVTRKQTFPHWQIIFFDQTVSPDFQLSSFSWPVSLSSLLVQPPTPSVLCRNEKNHMKKVFRVIKRFLSCCFCFIVGDVFVRDLFHCIFYLEPA